MISSLTIRAKYLEFFRTKSHAILPSAPLVPENDPSVLFNTAGMQPLVPYLLGEPHPLGKRLSDVQKCVRTGDIDDVGDDTHLTFFEMLGNWSLGDYFKKESIEMSWEFLTSPEWLALDPRMISVTVFEGDANAPRDEESADIWKSLGMPNDRIAYLPAEDNWWAAGPTGPCGPDTEIFYYMGEGLPPAGSNKGTDSKMWMEIWNNVFMQYNRVDSETLEPLPAPCVDTGMGLERVTAALNQESSVYHTDCFSKAISYIHELFKTDLKSDIDWDATRRSTRIIADHLRTATHMISDGVTPKNIDQGYILRRLIRRAIREAYKMGYEQAFVSEIARIYIDQFADIYPIVSEKAAVIISELDKEEAQFAKKLKDGVREFEKMSRDMQAGEVLSGQKAFTLFDTYGFPLEMTIELARERGYSVDTLEFDRAFKEHQDKSRTAAAGKFVGGLGDTSPETIALHSACHLMLAGLRKVLGDHVHQAGSNITPERLRFDFTHGEKMTDEQKKAVESYVNEAIASQLKVKVVEMSKHDAQEQGVEGSFWEKYPDIVKVYQMTGENRVIYSQELCGGPHVDSSANMGVFRIVKEEASSAGVRRIKATLTK